MPTDSPDPDREANGLDHEVTAPRASTEREWELFAREDEADPLTHVGSVTAPSADVAVEQAERLFDHAVETLWCCPADEVTRRTTADAALANR